MINVVKHETSFPESEKGARQVEKVVTLAQRQVEKVVTCKETNGECRDACTETS